MIRSCTYHKLHLSVCASMLMPFRHPLEPLLGLIKELWLRCTPNPKCGGDLRIYSWPMGGEGMTPEQGLRRWSCLTCPRRTKVWDGMCWRWPKPCIQGPSFVSNFCAEVSALAAFR